VYMWTAGVSEPPPHKFNSALRSLPIASSEFGLSRSPLTHIYLVPLPIPKRLVRLKHHIALT
jgi:hypothetical protein